MSVRSTVVPAVLLLTLCLLAPPPAVAQVSPAAAALPSRPVAAPPTDLLSGRLRLPDPAAVARPSTLALIEVEPDGEGRFETAVPVETGGALRLALLGPDVEGWTLAAGAPGEAPRPVASLAAEGRARAVAGDLAPLLPGASATRWELSTGRAGSWTVRVEGVAPGDGRALLLVDGDGPWSLRVHTDGWHLTSDRSLAVVASLAESGAQALPASADLALRLDTPAGVLDLPLRDDGRSADGAAGDGVFGARLPPLPPGTALARVRARGAGADGSPFLLTSRLLLPVHEPDILLTGAADAAPADADRLAIDLPVWRLGAPERVHVSAEVWGHTVDGSVVPVAWVSTQQAPLEGADGERLELLLDGRWLARAGATPPLQLRAVRLQDVDTHVVLDERAALDLPVGALPPSALLPPGPITPTMTGGPPPALPPGGLGHGLVGRAEPVPPGLHALMLVHGYCSEGVWPPSDFSGDLLVFLDPNQNRSHEEFAQLLGAFGAQADSFGVVAHSQGGAAALQLLTYSFSGLDLAQGGRRIQSVGTPYQGTPLAGNLAALGEVFGTGCGENYDMSPEGSALWLASIPTWAREEVFYYTTSTGGLWCNFLTNLFLASPNDGVVEMAAGQLPGGNDQGHTTGECHTTGMNDPAQYLDAARNAVMDAAAAR